jgi:endo-1,4-beta-D-glucanase Y
MRDSLQAWDRPDVKASTADGKPSSDPNPSTRPDTARAINGAAFPFPQNRTLERCLFPTNYRNNDVQKAYDKWRAELITTEGAKGFRRVKRLATDPILEVGSTVSEGIAYGMIIAVYMNDQDLFDQLWKYEQQFLNGNGLMDWYISAAGDKRLGGGAATDADEDMAFALLMADRQWGGKGSLAESYLDTAKSQIQKIWDHEVLDGKLLRAGDEWGADWNTVNISYFSPAYYRLFGQATNKVAEWDAVVTTSYDILEKSLNLANGNTANGLVPAWCTAEGVPRPGFDGAPTHYQYDSCRTPFRIALDYYWFGEPRALAYITKTTTFFASIGADKIQDGYELNGTPRPSSLNPQYQQSAAFVGPAGVAAMGIPNYQKFLDDTYVQLATLTLMKGGEYYDHSWTVISLLMMTGNFNLF